VPTHAQRYVLLNRDGVINRRIMGGHVTSWQKFEFLPRTLEALRILAQNGYAALVISNQSCVGEKLLTTAQLELITQRFLTEVALAGGNIQQIYYCVHQPSDRCDCRKPKPGSIHRAQLDYAFVPQNTHFIGDSLEDVQAAASAGCPAVLLRRDAFLEPPVAREAPCLVASDLYDAAEMIIALDASGTRWPEGPLQSSQSIPSSHSIKAFHAQQR
jgi:D-glycero-D-manno-heptose 1,7-bisphosphate phosphatase